MRIHTMKRKAAKARRRRQGHTSHRLQRFLQFSFEFMAEYQEQHNIPLPWAPLQDPGFRKAMALKRAEFLNRAGRMAKSWR